MKPNLEWERGVSSVVGVVIVVALVTILGALVGGYVFGVQDRSLQEPAPQVNWEYEYDGGALTVRHEAGDSLDPTAVYVRENADPGSEQTWGDMGGDTTDGEVRADDTVTVAFSPSSDAEQGVTIYWRIVDPDPENSRSVVIGRWDGPEP
jgi:FlaG/FlaF family flagellin (archaellin)